MITVSVDTSKLKNVLEDRMLNVVHDENTMLQVHNLFAKMCDPYVPMETGTLAQTTEITSEGVTYKQPYAHYQYVGQVYGPNIPIIENGVITGWFSPPGQKKHPTGTLINYSKEAHPLATSYWDKAMYRDNKDKFDSEVKEILVRRYRDLYGE